jgi:predicted nucleotidyltransferase
MDIQKIIVGSTNISIQDLQKLVVPIFEKHKVDFAFIFGSSVLENKEQARDIDLSVGLRDYENWSSKMQFEIYAQLLTEIEKVTKIINFDFSIFETLPLKIKFNILKYGILLFVRDKMHLESVYEYVQIHYPDNKIWIDKQIKQIQNSW